MSKGTIVKNSLLKDGVTSSVKIYDKIANSTISEGTATIQLSENQSIYKITPTADFTVSIDTSKLSIPENSAITFYLLVDESEATDAWQMTNADDFKWGNTSPTMTAMVKYLFAFSSFDGGQTWVANQMYSWE